MNPATPSSSTRVNPFLKKVGSGSVARFVVSRDTGSATSSCVRSCVPAVGNTVRRRRSRYQSVFRFRFARSGDDSASPAGGYRNDASSPEYYGSSSAGECDPIYAEDGFVARASSDGRSTTVDASADAIGADACDDVVAAESFEEGNDGGAAVFAAHDRFG